MHLNCRMLIQRRRRRQRRPIRPLRVSVIQTWCLIPNPLVMERKKDETPEEKRARKQEVKATRRVSLFFLVYLRTCQFWSTPFSCLNHSDLHKQKQREEKKSNRQAYKDEEMKQRHLNATNFTRGKTVVQYTL